MKRPARAIVPLVLVLIVQGTGCGKDPVSDNQHEITWLPVTENVNGSLSTVEQLRILKVFGSHYEMGYAHGYLLGPEIFERQESVLARAGLLELYENQVLPNLDSVHFPDEYYDEIRGNFDGVKARTARGEIYSEILGREATFNDALALNCLNAFASQGMCSSFSAWGDMTYDGTVLTAYNHDCLITDEHTGKWYVIVRVPVGESGALPSVCVGLAGDLNIHTGMNSDGITLSCQSINTANSATSTDGFTSEGIIFRKLVETVSAASPVEDIESVLNVLYGVESEALMMSWPNLDQTTHAAALEIDGNLSQNHGFSLRYPDNEKQYIIQTNHFWLRYPPPTVPCARYGDIETSLASIASGVTPPLTIQTAWDLLRDVRNGGDFLTEIAVVFEPEKKLMHVAIAEPGKHAHECSRVTLDLVTLTGIP